jgi:hypothetical protein
MTGFFKDLFSGNFTGVWQDVVSAFQRLPVPVQTFVVKLEGDGGQLLQSLAATGIQDVVAGGFSTASFVTAGKDIVAKGLAQGQTILMQDAMAQLNILAASMNPPQPVVAAPTATVAPTAAPEAVPVVETPPTTPAG